MLVGDGFTLSNDACAGQKLAARGNCTLSVSFTPTLAAPAASTLAPLDSTADGAYVSTYIVAIGSTDINTAMSGYDCNEWRATTDMGQPIDYTTQVETRNLGGLFKYNCAPAVKLYCLYTNQ